MRTESGKAPIEFEKLDHQELEKIKRGIRLKARKEKWKIIWLFVISVLVTGLFFLLIFI